MERLTHAGFQKKLKDKYNDKFTLLSGYCGTRATIKVKCNDCGSIKEIRAGKLLYLGTCRGCFNKRHTKKHEKFKQEVFDKYGDEITLLSKYTYAKDRVLIRYNKCGHECKVMATAVLQAIGCRQCQPLKLRAKFSKTKEEFVSQVRGLVGDEYSFLGDYINANVPSLFRHNKCGHEYMAKPNGFLQGKRCRACMNESRRIKNNINQKITKRLRGRILSALQGHAKSASTMALLGCSIKQLRRHLENLFSEGMTWENHGKGGWDLDHIRPCASFNLRFARQQRKCFHHTNLQPLWASDNYKKGSTWKGKRYRGGLAIAPTST